MAEFGNKNKLPILIKWKMIKTTVVRLSREATLSNKAINLCHYYYQMYLLLPLTKGHLSNVATISWQIGWHY